MLCAATADGRRNNHAPAIDSMSMTPATNQIDARRRMDQAGCRTAGGGEYEAPPVPACGRVLYSSYHTRGHRARLPFPLYCPDSKMLPQERILEFLIYELSACVGPIG